MAETGKSGCLGCACPDGMICNPTAPFRRIEGVCDIAIDCVESCATAGCPTDLVCGPSGRCIPGPCDAPGALACPPHWRCAPQQVPLEPSWFDGSDTDADWDASTTTQRGCVRKRCDEVDGFTCRQFWACDPAPSDNQSGCVPIDCALTGHCSNDARYICVPVSPRARPVIRDLHGCIGRNCEEGLSCTYEIDFINVGYCDFDGPWAAYDTGCAAHRCDDVAGLCPEGNFCDPASPTSDARGCRWATCKDPTRFACQAPAHCDPSSPAANSFGCVDR